MRLTLLLIAVFLYSNTSAQAKKEPQYINAIVGFYNVENLYDTIDDPKIDDQEFLPNSPKKYNTYAYNRKLSNMATVIKNIGIADNPDGLALLGVVEIENETVLKDLAASDSLKDRNYQYVNFASPDARGIDVGLMYQPKYFTVIQARPHHVQLPDKHPTRDILVVKGDLVGDTVFVLVNHWPSRRGGSNMFDLNNKERSYNRNNRVTVDRVSGVQRQGGTELTDNDGLRNDGEESSRPARAAAAKACVVVMDSIYATNPNAKIIIMGDLNDDPISPSVTNVIQAKDNAVDVQPKGMYNALGNFFKKGYGTLAYNGKWNLFDQLLFSHSFLDQQQLNGWFFYSAHIFARDYLINQKGDYKGYPKRSWVGNNWNSGYSDHLPVYSILVRALPE
jgi:predicted extracellular nuclease